MSNLQTFNRTITSERTQAYLQSVLGAKKSSFVNNLTALVANNRNLQSCEALTLMYAGIKATALDLPLDANLGFAYVIPYKNTRAGVVEAQFQIGYKGFIQLAIRSGQFSAINTTDIREGELQDYDLLTGEMKFRRIDDRLKKPVVGYVAYFRLTNGFAKSLYMTIEELRMHASRYSQTFASKNSSIRDSSKWSTDFDAMAKKTVLKLLLSKYAPMSVEMSTAISSDQAVMRAENTYDYVDNDKAPEVDNRTAEEVKAKADAVKAKVADAMKAQASVVEVEPAEEADSEQDETIINPENK